MAKYWAQLSGTLVVNVSVADDTWQAPAGYVDVTNTSPRPGPGWTMTAGGANPTFAPPPIPVTVQNAATIQANLTAHLAQVEQWVSANPNGALLTAGQTLWVAKSLAGLIRLLLGVLDSAAST